MKYSFIYVAAILFTGITNLHAQSKDEAKYRAQSEDIRKEVWAWDMP